MWHELAWARFLSGAFDGVTSAGHRLSFNAFPHWQEKASLGSIKNDYFFHPPTHISLILDETHYIKGVFNVCKLFPSMEGMMHSQVFLHISVGCKLDWLMTCSHFPTYFDYRYSPTKDHSPSAKLWSQAALRCAPPSSHHAQSILLVLILQCNFNLVDFVRDNLPHKDVSIHSYELVKLLAFSMWLELEKKLMLTVLGDVNASCLLTP